jgi:hypothetical protein
MRGGAVAYKQTVLTAHPVETIQKTVRVFKSRVCARVYNKLYHPILNMHFSPLSYGGSQCSPPFLILITMQHFKNQWDSNLFLSEKVHGGATAFERKLDRHVLEGVQRGAGLESSHLLLDAHLGRADKIDLEDFMNGACLPRRPPCHFEDRGTAP